MSTTVRDKAVPETYPSYLALCRSGELDKRIQEAYGRLGHCNVCPRCCGADRLAGRMGFCRTGLLPKVSSFGPHFGEEPPLVGRHGSGTIFLARCSLACRYCQNYRISHRGEGDEVTCREMAGMMVSLQARGCHNINLVTPSHVVPQILRSLAIAVRRGLRIPLVYNSGGYDSVETLRLLDGIIDIYMPDAKYGDGDTAAALSAAPDYVPVMKAAIREMHRQAGDLIVKDGLAVRGLIIRHLVLPDNLASSDLVLPWIARCVSPDSYVNVMDQYRWSGTELPAGGEEETPRYAALRRPITDREYATAVRWAREAGLHRGFPA